MSLSILFFITLSVTIGIVLFWKYVWPKLMIPNGIHIGPIIKGKTRSVGMPKYLDNTNSFDFPQDPEHVNAIVVPCKNIGNTITLRYRIEGDTTFHPQENPSAPATVSLMIQRKGDDYTAKGDKVLYRLYAPGPQELVPGEHTLTVDLTDMSGWIGVMSNDVTPTIMKTVRDNLYGIHICFGSYGGRAHGVFAKGKARFTLVDLRLG